MIIIIVIFILIQLYFFYENKKRLQKLKDFEKTFNLVHWELKVKIQWVITDISTDNVWVYLIDNNNNSESDIDFYINKSKYEIFNDRSRYSKNKAKKMNNN